MPEPAKIRNVAVVGHRGTGKTSLVEAILFQSCAVNRLGAIEQGTTVADWDEEEHKRQMSLAATVCHAEWQGRKINLLDTPGDTGFQGDAIASLRVVEGALVVVSGVAVHLPIGSEHELTGIVDLIHMTAYTSPEGAKEAAPGEIPADLADQVAEYREKLL